MMVCDVCGMAERVKRVDMVKLCFSCRRIQDLMLVLELRIKVRTFNGSSIIPYPKDAQIMMMKEVRARCQTIAK